MYDGLISGLPITLVLVLLVSGLRSRRLGAAALFLAVLGLSMLQGTFLLLSALASAILVVLLVRFGLLALVAAFVPGSLLATTAIRFDTAPYATGSYVVIGVVAALTLYAVHTALGGRSLLGDAEPGATASVR